MPDVGNTAVQVLASSAPTETVLAALLNDIEAMPVDLVLALDDYHLVDSPQVHEASRSCSSTDRPGCSS